MDRSLRRLLDAIPRPGLIRLGRAVGVRALRTTPRPVAIERLAGVAGDVLERGLAEAIAAPDLRALCRRLGYSDRGRRADLAARLIAAVEDAAPRPPRWRSFAAARAWARALQLPSQTAWYAWIRRARARGEAPDDIPNAPHAAYARTGWTSWGDFLGTNNPARHLVGYRPFPAARAYARSLCLASAQEWKAHCARRVGNRRVLPADIPAAPWRVYAGKGWVSFGDWLGTGRVHASKIRYRSYARTRAFVRSLGIRTGDEWRAYCAGAMPHLPPRPVDVPTNPQRTYRGKGWTSWGELFGTGALAPWKRRYRSLPSARAFARRLGLPTVKAWTAWSVRGERPADIPAAPDQVYADRGWVSWGDFLGTRAVSNRKRTFRPFRAARAHARTLGLSGHTAWSRWSSAGHRPPDLPAAPDVIYRGRGWTSWGDFLGTGHVQGGNPRRRAR